VDKTAPADQTVLWHLGECGKDANLDRRFGLCASGDRAQTAQAGGATLHIAAGLSVTVFEKIEIQTAFSCETDSSESAQDDIQLNLLGFNRTVVAAR
jgi:hypothetical protein